MAEQDIPSPGSGDLLGVPLVSNRISAKDLFDGYILKRQIVKFQGHILDKEFAGDACVIIPSFRGNCIPTSPIYNDSLP